MESEYLPTFMIKHAICAVLLLGVTALCAQGMSRQITAKFTTDNIRLDGVLDDQIWQNAEVIGDFWQFFPSDSVGAKNSTEVKIAYNEKYLYAAIRAEVVSDNFVVSTLRRDFGGSTNDNVTLMFDTYSDGANAFLFGVTPYGVQRDALLSLGGSAEGFNTTWDIKWVVESQMYRDHYTIEIAIPFSSLKFREGADSWRFQVYRWDLQTNEQSVWARVPQNQLLSSLAFMGELKFEHPLGASRRPLAVVPYLNALAQNNFITDVSDQKIKTGGDAKVSIGGGMNLDITANPDFSNVEVDDIFTNLTRFEISLPEKRQFFIDNNDLFGSFGSIYGDATPFFSRRIGIARDSMDNSIENRILGGVRLSGKINNNWRLGFLNLQTDEVPDKEIPSNNNMMLAVQKKVFARSNVGFFAINRQTFKEYDFQENDQKFNRVMGIDYNLASKNNTWTGKFYTHKSLQPGDSKGNLSSQATVTYNSRYYNVVSDIVYVDRDFKSDLGFIPRADILKLGNGVARYFWPRQGRVNRHTARLLSLTFWRPGLDYKRTDQEYRVIYNLEFKNQSTAGFRYNYQYIYLTRAFDPTRTPGAKPLPANADYRFHFLYAEYQSNRARLLILTTNTTIGAFFNGQRASVSGTLALRVQPKALISLVFNYDKIRLPDPYPDADLWLISPKLDFTFSKSLFWSTLIQYSKQRDNLGINSRLQWRFSQLSDLYIVYNDNYYTSYFEPRFRSINLKLTYWLNI